ncbi:MAG: restriction endonuclease, partial [Pseudomonadota bacterium]
MNLARQEVRDLLLICGDRAGKALGFSTNPLTVAGESVRAFDMAGLLRVAPGIEIEISPKFLGLDSDNSRWREDFFFIATLSRHGRLLNAEQLRASPGDRGDLHTLVARAMTGMFWSNYRRPLRSYRPAEFEDFSLDGDVDAVDVLQPTEDGFRQTSMAFDRQNVFNGTILTAARQLLVNLRDPIAIAQLERMIAALAPQRSVGRIMRKSRLPSRSKRWQPLFDLSVDVINGFGLTYKTGSARAPGYILNTWRVWEDLLGVALRVGLGSNRVQSQLPRAIGTRRKYEQGALGPATTANVTPDLIVLSAPQGEASFIVDAKYKGHVERGRNRISEADVYEALAFARATGCDTVILAYPA